MRKAPRRRLVPLHVMIDLSGEHRATAEKILRHPAGGNIEWREVRALLEAVGATTELPGGRLEVTLGGETEVLQPPHGKDVDVQMIVDLRRMLTAAGAASRTSGE
jgi:hypothetical protein